MVVVIDPFAKEIGLASPRFKADIALVTHDHPDHSFTESLGGEPLVIKGPGEYEAKGVYIHGIRTFHDAVGGKERGVNTVYKITWEDIRIVHLGDLGEKELSQEALDEIGEVDILMVPVGGTYTIDGKEAVKIVKQIEPRYVIPMHYKITGLKVDLDDAQLFLKEMGASKTEAQDKFTLKKKDIGEDEKTEVIVLKTV